MSKHVDLVVCIAPILTLTTNAAVRNMVQSPASIKSLKISGITPLKSVNVFVKIGYSDINLILGTPPWCFADCTRPIDMVRLSMDFPHECAVLRRREAPRDHVLRLSSFTFTTTGNLPLVCRTDSHRRKLRDLLCIRHWPGYLTFFFRIHFRAPRGE